MVALGFKYGCDNDDDNDDDDDGVAFHAHC